MSTLAAFTMPLTANHCPRGQVQMDIDLQNVDINQCASGPGWYSNTHLCDLNSTQVRIRRGGGGYRVLTPPFLTTATTQLPGAADKGTPAFQGFRGTPSNELKTGFQAFKRWGHVQPTPTLYPRQPPSFL